MFILNDILLKKNLILFIIINNFYLFSLHLRDCNSISLKDNNIYNCDGARSNCCYKCGITTFIPRGQGADTARELVGWQDKLYRNYCQNYGIIEFTAAYSRSMNPKALAKLLFCTNCLTFAGSQNKNREDGKDLIADYFGLSTNFFNKLFIKPKISNNIVDIDLYAGLNEWCFGLWTRLHIPLVYTKWCLGLNESISCYNRFIGDSQFPTGYMYSATPGYSYITVENQKMISNPQCRVYTALNPNIEVYPTTTSYNIPYNCTTDNLRTALSGDFTFGDMTERWKYGKFKFAPISKFGLADLTLLVGYNFIEEVKGHAGIYLQAVFPTGNRPNGKYIFQPIVGNGEHFELGGGITAHFPIAIKEDRSIYFYLEGNVTHMFPTIQKRSFDFKENGFLSRYILLKEYDIDNNYVGRMINAINFTTRDCKVAIPYQVDMSFKLMFKNKECILDLGYNIYARAREKITIKPDCNFDIDTRRFAIKGLDGVASITYNVLTNTQELEAGETATLTKLNANQSDANMFNAILPTSASMELNPTEINLNYNTTNSDIVNALKNFNGTLQVNIPLNDITPENGFIIANTTAIPKIISCADLDPTSAAQCSMLTHKFFVHINYSWDDYMYQPFVGIGGATEFNGKDIKNALSQWFIWLKTGLEF